MFGAVKLGLVEPGWTLVFQIFNTLILFGFLRWKLFGPVTEFMKKRQEGIANSLKEADNKNEEARLLIEQYNAKLEKADEEGNEIIKAARVKAEVRASEIIKHAEAEIKSLKESAEKEIVREKEKAINELKDEIAELAILAASKVIEKDLDKAAHDVMIKQFIDKVGDAKWHN